MTILNQIKIFPVEIHCGRPWYHIYVHISGHTLVPQIISGLTIWWMWTKYKEWKRQRRHMSAASLLYCAMPGFTRDSAFFAFDANMWHWYWFYQGEMANNWLFENVGKCISGFKGVTLVWHLKMKIWLAGLIRRGDTIQSMSISNDVSFSDVNSCCLQRHRLGTYFSAVTVWFLLSPKTWLVIFTGFWYFIFTVFFLGF